MMKNLRSLITRLYFIFSLVAFIGLSVYLLLTPRVADAFWYNDSFSFRQVFSFTHNADVGAERSITVSLDTAELITASVMQSDCDDTRFTDANGKVLKLQLTGTCNNAATTYEVVFPNIINGTNSGYVYYGNPSATTTSQDVSSITQLTPSGGDPSITTRTNEEKGPSPVLHYSFDEVKNAIVEDSSSNNNDGLLGGELYTGSYVGLYAIDDAGDAGALADGGRQVVRTSTGTLYAFLNDGGSCEMWKSSDGTTWTEQDSANNPACLSGDSVAMSIDSTNVLHLIYVRRVTSTDHVYYRTFDTSTDTFGTESTAISNATSGRVYGISIAVDSNNNPHVAAGGEYTFGLTVRYRVNISGTWQTVRTVESFANFASGPEYPDITINEDNIPEISYTQTNSLQLTVALGNANNASSFTLHDVDTSVPANADSSITVDSSGNTWVAYIDENGANDYVTLLKHNDADAWSTWQAPLTNSNVGVEPSIAINGGTIYIFYQEENGDIVNDRYNGSVWFGEDVFLAGPYQDVKARWSFLNNYSYSTTGIDYLVSNGTDVYWGSIPVGTATGVPTLHTDDMCLSNNCLYFDGNDDTVVTSNANSIDLDLLLANAFTFTAWVRPNSDGENDVGQIFNKGSNTFFRVDSQGSDSLVDLEVSVDLVTSDATLNVSDALRLNQWSYVAVSYQDDADDEVTVYVNGRAVGTSSNGSGAPIPDSEPLLIGGSTSANYHGSIDDFKVYSQVLSAGQINANYVNKGSIDGASVVLGSSTVDSLSNGLVGYWPMDEAGANSCTGGVNDSCDRSGNNNNGAWTGNVAVSSGKFGNSTSFDGTGDFIQVPHNANQTVTNEFTVSSWLNISDPNADQTDYIFSKASHLSADGFGIAYVWNDGSNCAALDVRLYNTSYSTDEIRYGTSCIIPASTWTFISATMKNSNLQLFINGTLQLNQVLPISSIDTTTTDIFIGDFDEFNQPVQGSLDEVRFYNRSLTQSDIAQLYNWAPGPVGHWKMDEKAGTTAYDMSSNGNNMSINNGPFWTSGKYGSSLSFDGNNDYLVAPHSSSLNVGQADVTISAWIKPASDPGGGYTNIITKGQGNGGRQFNLRVGCSGGDIICAEFGHTSSASFTQALAIGQWQHLTVTRSGTTATLYYNGNLVSTSTGITATSTNISDVEIGGTSGGGTFDGVIDNVLIYNYARSAAQILQDMNAGQSVVDSPVAYLSFDEGYGTTANNSGTSGSALNGTLSNMASPAISTSGWTKNGKNGNAVVFDATDDDVAITETNKQLDFDQNMSITAWIYPTGWGEGNYGTIVARSPGSDQGYQFEIANGVSSYTAALAIWDGDGGVGSSYANNAIALNTWQHVAVTVENDNERLYVNGKEVTKTGDFFNDLASTGSNATVYIGSVDGNNDTFQGRIDEVKLYNTPLTSAEILLDYNQGKSLTLGSLSTTSTGVTDNSSNREYCVPGDASACNPPIGEWKLDEGSGTTTYDTSGNGSNGTLGGNTSWVSAKYSKGLSFDGTGDSVDLGTSATLRPTQVSVEAWIKPTNAMLVPFQEAGIVSNQNWSNNGGYSLHLKTDASGNNVQVRFRILNGTTHFTTTSWNNVMLNQWNHVIGTFDGSTVRIYLNGVFENEQSASTSISYATANNLYIGIEPWTSSMDFPGVIDNVKIFNYARTPSQVMWGYNRGKPLAHWQFDETTGSTAYDNSGYGFHGTLTNSPLRTSNGKFNSGINFDGLDDYVTIPDNDFLSVHATGFAISAWFNADTLDAGTRNYIVAKGTTSNYEWALGSYGSTDAYCETWDLNGDNHLGRGGAEGYSTGVPVTTGEWHHIVCVVIPSTRLEIYLDGKLRFTDTSATGFTMGNGTSTVDIGRRADNADSEFDGKIDDVKIFNHPLNLTQVNTIMNDGAAVKFN